MTFFKTLKQENQNIITMYMNHFLVLYAFFLPISHRATSALLVLIILLFIYRRNYIYHLKPIFKNKVVISFIFLYLLHVIWMLSSDNMNNAFRMYQNITYTLYPILFLSFLNIKFVSRVTFAFISGIFFTEVTSYLISLHILPWKLTLFDRVLYNSPVGDPTPFFNHSHYSTGLAIVIALLIYNLLTIRSKIVYKVLGIMFIFSATINLFIIGGRTGYLIYLLLIPLTFYLLYKKNFLKFLFPLLISIVIIFSIAYSFSPLFKARINYSMNTVSSLYNNPDDLHSSLGVRIGLSKYAIEVIKKNFIFGVGTGDHVDEMHKIIPQKHAYLKILSHPHNQLLSYFAQFGLFGFFVYLNIYYQIFKFKYSTIEQQHLAYIVSTAMFVALMFENFRVSFFLPIWITLISIAITNTNRKIDVDENKFHSIVLYTLITIAVSLNVYFQITK